MPDAEQRLVEEIRPILVLVLSYLDMLGVDGLELLGEIKQRRPDFRVMMVTAYGYDEHRRRLRNLSAHEFLTKPVDFDLLKAELQRLPRIMVQRFRRPSQ
jgi:DNA-binding response OmpR family regulator